MNYRYGVAVAAAATTTFLLAGCTGTPKTGAPSTAGTTSSATSEAAGLPHDGAPKVQNPLPAKVLDGSPCDTALTPAQLADFLGETKPATPSDDALGAACDWRSAGGTGAGFNIGYETKSA